MLPTNLILNPDQKRLIAQHIASLDEILLMSPQEDIRFGSITLEAVTKMTMVLPSRESGDLGGEAKGEAYMIALEDVPCWAVQEAMRKWYRSECGSKYEYKWQPVPPILRDISMLEMYRVKGIQRRLTEVLSAEPLIEFTPDQEAGMRELMADYLKTRSA